jgi:CarD family transcriptional regulator
MSQKKAKPTATKGKTGSEKQMPAKSQAKSTVKAAASAKASVKSTPSKAAPALAKKTSASATTKKPTSSAKLSVVANAPKAAPATSAKPAPSKVEMSSSVKKAEATKAAAPKAAVQKPTAAVKPVAMVKPVAPVAKPIAAAKAPAPAAKPAVAPPKPAIVAPVVVAAATPPAAPATGKPAFSGRPGFAPKPSFVMQKAPIAAPAGPAVAAPAASNEPKKPVSARHGFKTNEWIVYPAQGVGRIVAIEEQEIAGMKLELFVITFEKDKMTLRVPTGKAATHGMRKLAEDGIVKRAMETLKGKARIKRTMWSRRAQEFEAKINSGDLVSVAEVVRDLYRAESQPEQSYSERLLFERALDRMAREIAAVDKLDERGAAQKIVEVLSKSAKARKPAEETAVAAEDDAEDATAAA